MFIGVCLGLRYIQLKKRPGTLVNYRIVTHFPSFIILLSKENTTDKQELKCTSYFQQEEVQVPGNMPILTLDDPISYEKHPCISEIKKKYIVHVSILVIGVRAEQRCKSHEYSYSEQSCQIFLKCIRLSPVSIRKMC